jgi:hypothetical protein
MRLLVNRSTAEEVVWKEAHKDFKSRKGGVRQVLVNRGGATTLVPLSELSVQELDGLLPRGVCINPEGAES